MTEGLNERASKAVNALRLPDPAFKNVPNTVRQSVADVIHELMTEGDPRPLNDQGVREALEGMVRLYVELVESGDAGFWDPEEVKEVIAARAALKDKPHE